MSEPKLISPMLDGFVMGQSVSSHDGVRCCPAIRENTDERYIIKVISIPASQVQLEALLLTGAYANTDAALSDFKALADGVIKETEILTELSLLEGFLPYRDTQIVPMEDGVGYDVYLLSPYKRSLDKQMRRHPLTHLAAVNLGLDLCAALTVSRRAGYLYADLKPENIYVTETQGYRIGDLGFIPLASLKYASLPDKYHSSYTPPEITDAMAALNGTIDIFALGLVLYQVFNNGELPFEGNAPAEALPSPLYADYEMADIILKACAPNPADRWQDPEEMGQALVSYMQRNSVNDTSIVPPPVEIPENTGVAVDVEDFLPEEENEAQFRELLEALEEEVPPEEPEQAEVDEDTDLSFMEPEEDDETLPTEESTADIEDSVLSEEVSEMLAQADELISHELPEPPVAPDPIDIPIPPPIRLEPEEATVPAEEEATGDTETTEAQPTTDAPDEEETEPAETEPAQADPPQEPEEDPTPIAEEQKPKKKKRLGLWITLAAVVLLLCAAALGGRYYYQSYYLQTIDGITISGTEDDITVRIQADIDESLLTVVCTDTYGNTKSSPVTGGMAAFTDLNPNTQYKIRLEIAGSHKLQGHTTGSYTTAARTEILNFSATMGPEDGSVILSFSVTGPESEQWSVEYTGDNGDTGTMNFSGHTATITGLNVGETYTFRLVPKTALYLAGSRELTCTARKLIFAQEPVVTACGNGSLTVQWRAPEDTAVESWNVRCYNDTGYNVTITVTECAATFTDLDHTNGYTVEITAAGMPRSVSTSVTADPVTITGMRVDDSLPGQLTVSWDHIGSAPAGGWLLGYTVDESAPQTVFCYEAQGIVPNIVPGAHYEFTLRPASEVTFFGASITYDVPGAEMFQGYGVKHSGMQFSLCKTPDKTDWNREDLTPENYTSDFSVGEKVSLVVRLYPKYEESEDTVTILYCLRDTEGKPVSISSDSKIWSEMWVDGYCCLDIPTMPSAPGEYTLEIYLNGMLANTKTLTIQ